MRTDDEIQDQIAKAQDNNGQFPGMTYEEGVAAALLWVTGDHEDAPMED